MLGSGMPPPATVAFVLASAVAGAFAGTAMLVPAARSLRQGSLRLVPAVASVVITATAFAVVAVRFGPTAAIGPGIALAVVGAPLSLVDLAERRLPSSLTLPGFALGGGAVIVMATAAHDAGLLVRAVLMSLAVGASYLALALLSAGGLGAGDVKAAALVGLLLAPTGWSSLLVASTVTWVGAGAAAAAFRVLRRERSDGTVPLGPFLIVGAMIGALEVAMWSPLC